MRVDRQTRMPALFFGMAAVIAATFIGCGEDSSGPKTTQVSPEFQKKTDDYLKNYQQQMLDQHKTKGKAKKS